MSLVCASLHFISTGATLGRCPGALQPQVCTAANSLGTLFQFVLIDLSGFMALVALFLGAGELVTTPVPKDKQVGGTRMFCFCVFQQALKTKLLIQVDWEAILRINVKEFAAFVDPWFVRQP